ncbi:MAG: class I SAM-dependent methyltransferase [Proteobacteria bacterium]|nr:class I SAM-dependent methyltransferase [Pseudomonadota bacterium]
MERDRAILDEQIAYYRARAREYDAWWLREGRFDRGDDNNQAWHADARAVEAALAAFLDARKPARALELACGTGLFTRHLAPRVGTLTAVDAAPEVITLNRARLGALPVQPPRYVEADLFAWEPEGTYDLVFMSFWLSHVPAARMDAFWATVRRALAPGGVAYVIDSAHEVTSTAVDHPPPDAQAGVVTRKLDDGSTFRIVKMFWTPAALAARLVPLGFRADLAQTPRYFIYGPVAPEPSG